MLDEMLDRYEPERATPSRSRMAAQAFAVAVVTGVLGLALLSVLLYGVGMGAVVLWSSWWADFA